jgi:hypothetical protein
MGATATRKGSAPIKVWCLPEERQAIAAVADAAGLSLSAYLRKIGMGYEIRSILDQERIIALAKINADQGRLGGLLKLWLTNDEKLAGHNSDEMRGMIHRVLERILETQAALLEAAKKV